jgi:hypothetical protein
MIAIAAAVFQLAGTALLVWGLKLTSDMARGSSETGKKSPTPGSFENIHGRSRSGRGSFSWAFQVVDAILKARC